MNPILAYLASRKAKRTFRRVRRTTSRIVKSPAFLAAMGALAILGGLFYFFQFASSVVGPRHELAVLALDLTFTDKNVQVAAYYPEVGEYYSLAPYQLVRSSWSECSQGVSYTVYVDGNVSYGPYCLSGVGGFLKTLLEGGVYSHIEFALPPGYHTIRLVYTRDGKIVSVRTMVFTAPSVDDIKSCGGVYPCGGEANAPGQAG